ncbi:MAG: hypothetical protein IJF90_08730, partial [Synergistaceae bacterium]|nr:hypothetical protein [Synergistaceae bacterium]
MVIAHNIPALQTYNIVNNTSNQLQKSIAKLSSGLRINSAADDAAGLAISEKMRSQVRGLDRAVANTQDGISLIQTAEGALNETHSILQRMRELAVQGANDTLTQQDRSYIQEEIDQLKEEITRIGNTTQFNKKKLLNGDAAALWSSSDMETKAIINGGLREVDQFGQKKSVEGNYKIRVKAEPGQAEIQKSDIMTIKHAGVLTNKSINAPLGVKDVTVDDMTPGDYSLTVAASSANATGNEYVTGSYNVGGTRYKSTDGAVSANSANLTVGAGSSLTYRVQLGDTVLGDIKVTNSSTTATADHTITQLLTDTGSAATATVSGGKAVVGKARDMGVNLIANGTNLSIEKYGDKNWGDLSITVVDTGTLAADVAKKGTKVNVDAVNSANINSADIKTDGGGIFTIDPGAITKNASVLFEVTGTDALNGTVTLRATATMLDKKGNNTTATMDDIVLTQGGAKANLNELFDMSVDGTPTNNPGITLSSNQFIGLSKDSKFVVNFQALQTTDDLDFTLSGAIDSEWENTWSDGVFAGNKPTYTLNGTELANSEINFKNYILNEKTGTVNQGTVTLVTDETFTTDNNVSGYALTTAALGTTPTLASFTNTYIGKTANGDVKLRDLDKFWNSEGTFMLEDAKKLTLNQGNGKTADVMLYANDTLDEVATKINNAIASGLGQSQYVDDATKFATFVSTGKDLTAEAVPGTFVIRSVVPGSDGEITFSGDQGIIDALSLNTIQNSKETTYKVDVLDEHSGKIIAQGVKTTGNVLHGVIHDNVDVEFGALSGVTANWNSTLNKYTYTAEETESTLHLADNTTVLQIGANEGEDLGMNIGDMRSHALGIDGVNVMSHERAGRAITLIDNAIDRVSTQRANLGAYQNRLEYTASNLTTASENLTSAESRIRDADMAKEMMTFTKLNIMLQAGNSMLAQAN